MIDFQMLDYREFEILVGVLLKKEGHEIVRRPGRPGTMGPDYETIAPKDVPYIVEVKHFKLPVLGKSALSQFAGDLNRYRQQKPNVRGLLVVSSRLDAGSISEIARANDIEVWDGLVVSSMLTKYKDVLPMVEALKTSRAAFDAQTEALLSGYGNPVADLSSSLAAVHCGRDHWKDYERICTNILTYVLAPDLAAPEIQSRSDDGLDIIDAIFPIRSNQPPWSIVRSEYRTRFVVAEFKNYCDAIGQVQVESIAQYLWKPAHRVFGLLVSRQQPSSAAIAQRRRKWLEDEKCIVFLSDDDLLEMLQIRDSGGQPFDVVDTQLEDFFRTLTP